MKPRTIWFYGISWLRFCCYYWRMQWLWPNSVLYKINSISKGIFFCFWLTYVVVELRKVQRRLSGVVGLTRQRERDFGKRWERDFVWVFTLTLPFSHKSARKSLILFGFKKKKLREIFFLSVSGVQEEHYIQKLSKIK